MNNYTVLIRSAWLVSHADFLELCSHGQLRQLRRSLRTTSHTCVAAALLFLGQSTAAGGLLCALVPSFSGREFSCSPDSVHALVARVPVTAKAFDGLTHRRCSSPRVSPTMCGALSHAAGLRAVLCVAVAALATGSLQPVVGSSSCYACPLLNDGTLIVPHLPRVCKADASPDAAASFTAFYCRCAFLRLHVRWARTS
jgi:hypothetical protein